MPPTLTVVLDSNVYILGINRLEPDCAALLDILTADRWEGVLTIETPRMVERGVVQNLREISLTAPSQFYAILTNHPWNGVTYEDPPEDLILKYWELGLSEEHGIIGAFAEWVGAEYLVSQNRHFLDQLETDALEVVGSGDFVEILARKAENSNE
jgi:hypothetical protein